MSKTLTRLEALNWFARSAQGGDKDSHIALLNLLGDEDATQDEKALARQLLDTLPALDD